MGKVLKLKMPYILNLIPLAFFLILAHPAAFISAWLNIESNMTTGFSTPCRQEIPHFAYHKFNTGI